MDDVFLLVDAVVAKDVDDEIFDRFDGLLPDVNDVIDDRLCESVAARFSQPDWLLIALCFTGATSVAGGDRDGLVINELLSALV